MAYHKGVWESDRETRQRNERMWGEHKGKGGDKSKRPPGQKDDDLTRAMASDLTDNGAGAGVKTTGTLGIGTPGWQSQVQTNKIDRPIIPGGCNHTGGKLSITLSSGKRLYGAQALHIKAAAHLDLIIDCAGLLGPRKAFVAKATAPKYRALNLATWPDVITLAWPDMTAPTQVGFKFWARLLALLPQDTAVCCMGGHGRTGTALAALLVADGVEAETAITRVRTEHCARAIETHEQVGYIKALARERDSRAMDAKGGAVVMAPEALDPEEQENARREAWEDLATEYALARWQWDDCEYDRVEPGDRPDEYVDDMAQHWGLDDPFGDWPSDVAGREAKLADIRGRITTFMAAGK